MSVHVCVHACMRVFTRMCVCTRVRGPLGVDGAAAVLQEVEWRAGGAGTVGSAARAGALAASVIRAEKWCRREGTHEASGKSAVGFRLKISDKCQKSDDTIFLKGKSTSPPGGYEISFFSSLGGLLAPRPGNGVVKGWAGRAAGRVILNNLDRAPQLCRGVCSARKPCTSGSHAGLTSQAQSLPRDQRSEPGHGGPPSHPLVARSDGTPHGHGHRLPTVVHVAREPGTVVVLMYVRPSRVGRPTAAP